MRNVVIFMILILVILVLLVSFTQSRSKRRKESIVDGKKLTSVEDEIVDLVYSDENQHWGGECETGQNFGLDGKTLISGSLRVQVVCKKEFEKECKSGMDSIIEKHKLSRWKIIEKRDDLGGLVKLIIIINVK